MVGSLRYAMASTQSANQNLVNLLIFWAYYKVLQIAWSEEFEKIQCVFQLGRVIRANHPIVATSLICTRATTY